MTEIYDLDGDWYAVTSDTERSELENELSREICSDHILHGVAASAIARRWRRDDVLFKLEDGKFAQIHLTRRPEASPNFPTVDIYETFAHWKATPVEDR
jgi:hypothetical protein